MDSQPSGYLPMKERPAPGDKLILVPVYVVPVEILERSIMHGLRYLYQVVIVDGYNGRTTLEDKKSVDPDTDFVPETDEQECLELRYPLRLQKNWQSTELPGISKLEKGHMEQESIDKRTENTSGMRHTLSASEIDTFTGERSGPRPGGMFSVKNILRSDI